MKLKVIVFSSYCSCVKRGLNKEKLDEIRKSGFARVRVNGEMRDLSENIELDKNKKANIDVVVDRLIMKDDIRSRLYEALEVATKLANGKVIIDVVGDKEIVMSESFACPYCDFSLAELEPRLFSFNAPYGACEDCKGLGFKLEIDEDLLIPNKEISINRGAIVPLKNMDDINIYNQKLEIVCNYYGIDMNKKINDLKQNELDIILYGSPDVIDFKFKSRGGHLYNSREPYEGVIPNLERRYMETNSEFIRDWIGTYMTEKTCPTCGGARLKESVLSVLVGDKNIYEVGNLSIRKTLEYFENLKLTSEQEEISRLILKENRSRLAFFVM